MSERYKITDTGESILIKESNGIVSSVDTVDGEHLDDIVIAAFRQLLADNAALLAANRDLQAHFDALKADYDALKQVISDQIRVIENTEERLMEVCAERDAMKLRAERAEARLAAIDNAPTGEYCHGNDNRRLRIGDDEAH